MVKIESPELDKARKALEADKKLLANPEPKAKTEEPKVVENAPTAEVKPEELEVKPTAIQAPTPTDDELRKQLAERDAKIAELTKRVNTEDGRNGRELQRLREQLAEMNDRLTAQATAKVEKQTPPQNAVDPLLEGIAPEDLEQYDEKSLAVLKAIARNAAKNGVSKQDLAPLQEVVQRTAARAGQESFSNTVESLAPGFKKANGDAELGIAPDPSWQEFLGKPVNPELSEETWFQYAERIGGPKVAAAVYRKYEASKGSQAPVVPVTTDRPSLAGQVAPAKSGGVPEVRSKADAPLRRSDFETLQRDAARPGGLTDEVRAKFKAFLKAAAENRLID